MSDKKREPILSDAAITNAAKTQGEMSMSVNGHDFAAGERARGYTSGAVEARYVYEAARAKDHELIQRLVDALYGEARGRSQAVSTASIALADAEAAGFKPTDQ